MPGFSSLFDDTVRLDMAEVDPAATGYWVDLKRALSRKDNAAISRALMRQQMREFLDQNGTATSRELTTDYNGEEANSLRVLASIVAWNLDDVARRTLPISRESVDGLPSPVFNFLARKALEFNSPRKEAEQAAFRDGSAETQPGDGGRAAQELEPAATSA